MYSTAQCTYILVVLLFPLYSVQLIPAVCLFTVPEVFKVPGAVLRLLVSTSSVVLPCVHAPFYSNYSSSTCSTPLYFSCSTCRTPLYSAVVPATLPPHYCTSVIRAVLLSTGPAVPAILFSTTHAVFLSTTLAVHPALLSALSEVLYLQYSSLLLLQYLQYLNLQLLKYSTLY